VKQRSVLAILLLHAGEVVSIDRLVDGVWGESPPEDAATALHQHVSRLRKLLHPHAVIETRSPGYVIPVDAASLDLRRFESLGERGRMHLEAGRADAAARLFTEALGLWRGRPFADLDDEPFARDATVLLDEAWLVVLEQRIEADLALGRHGELVGELRALVRRHPLRERLRAQLMLALYRSGRQAEALETYAEARRMLVDELGLEPGPALQRLQQAVLRHDPTLELARAAQSGSPSHRRTGAVLVAGALVALAAVATGIGLAQRGNETAAGSGRGAGQVLAIDGATGAVERRLAAGRVPAAVAARDGHVWIVDAEAQTVVHIDQETGTSETLATGATPTDVAAGPGVVWVANGRRLDRAQFVGPVATAVSKLDPATRTERADVPLPLSGGDLSNLVDNHVAATPTAVWAVTPSYGVVRIDGRTGRITASTDAVRAVAIAAGAAGVWALGADGTVARLDESTARPRVRTRIPAASVTAIAVDADGAWVTSATDGTLWRVSGSSKAALGSIELASGAADVAAGLGHVWVVNPVVGTLTAVEAKTGTIARVVNLDGVPRSVAVDGDTVWVVADGGPAAALEETAGIRPLPASSCEPVLANGEADLLVVSDLPLQGGIRENVQQMAQAITFVLRDRRFRAGRFRLAYQSCDDSIARTGLFDEEKCRANARAYARNEDVVALVGWVNTPCALAALPTLNAAAGGAVGVVSPLTSFGGLTRPGVGVPSSLPASLYPTGRRNYVRVNPADDLQGAALALFARQRGEKRVFVLDDGDPGYGALMAAGFETAARRLGLTVAGRASWDPRAPSYARLADRVAASGATAVLVAGLLDTNAARVVRDLRTRLPVAVDLLAPSLGPVPLLVQRAGRSAYGTYLSLAGVVTERLSPAGTRFVERFGRTQAGAPVQPSAVYAAQATHVLLDAIRRSDGTRSSVVEELFRTRVSDGLLGSFSFDRNGDISESPITILQVRPSGASRGGEFEGAAVVRVVRPSASLVAPPR
jgi:DNA-binding SARP family transcriptional activator/ABC-type branched-subunit amino acid transport system substrate-binding protein